MLLGVGRALQVEDLSVTLKVVRFTDSYTQAYLKHKGKASKRRFENIMKMAKRRAWQLKDWSFYAKS